MPICNKSVKFKFNPLKNVREVDYIKYVYNEFSNTAEKIKILLSSTYDNFYKHSSMATLVSHACANLQRFPFSLFDNHKRS